MLSLESISLLLLKSVVTSVLSHRWSLLRLSLLNGRSSVWIQTSTHWETTCLDNILRLLCHLSQLPQKRSLHPIRPGSEWHTISVSSTVSWNHRFSELASSWLHFCKKQIKKLSMWSCWPSKRRVALKIFMSLRPWQVKLKSIREKEPRSFVTN